MTQKDKFKIAVIDDCIDIYLLKKLVPYFNNDINIILCGESFNYDGKSFQTITHGTLCCGLLIESLQDKIYKNINITFFPINNKNGEKDLNNFVSVLKYCAKNDFDMISISLGIYSLKYSKEMLKQINKIHHAIIIASASNNDKICYPSAFDKVVGVKKSEINNENIYGIDQPLDGIEILLPYTTTKLLELLKNNYGLDYSNSNSILAPRLCGILANKLILEKEIVNNKKDIFNLIDCKVIKGNMTKNSNKIVDIPVILVEYNDNEKEYKMDLVWKLQMLFEYYDYSCPVLYDGISGTDFEKGWYTISIKNFYNFLTYYYNKIFCSFFIVLSKKGLVNQLYIDYKLPDQILNKFVTDLEIINIYQTIINYFKE